MKLFPISSGAPMYTNTFLIITAAGHGIAIDPAAPAQAYLGRLAQQGATLTHILLTHGHYDHVGSVEALAAATGAAVLIEPGDVRGNHYFPLGGAYNAYPADGQLAIDELAFRVWRTPGHTPGSVCLYCEGMLFSGDTLFAGSCGRVDLQGGDAAQMRKSLALLAGLPLPDSTKVLPGHDRFTTLGEERASNPYLLGMW